MTGITIHIDTTHPAFGQSEAEAAVLVGEILSELSAEFVTIKQLNCRKVLLTDGTEIGRVIFHTQEGK